RARAGHLPDRRRGRGRARGPTDGPRRTDAGDPGRVRARRDRLRCDRGRLRARLGPGGRCPLRAYRPPRPHPPAVSGGRRPAGSSALLPRAAAAEMFPPEFRGRGMGLVLFGAASGAIWGPLVFGPMFADRSLDAHGLVGPWLMGIPFLVAGLAIAFAVRPDPK